MKLTLEYLKERHSFWKEEIGKAGIWNPQKFKTVHLEIRNKSKTYNGLFHRKWVKCNVRYRVVDRLIIYNNVEDFDLKFLDSLIVHEMIHQYIFQNKIIDTSTHGKIFKDFMTKINNEFKNRIDLNTRDTNPNLPKEGPGDTVFNLLLILQKNNWFCCVVRPGKVKHFHNHVITLKQNKKIKDFGWLQSNDIHFNQYPQCTKYLHGEKLPFSKMIKFLKKYNAKKSSLNL